MRARIARIEPEHTGEIAQAAFAVRRERSQPQQRLDTRRIEHEGLIEGLARRVSPPSACVSHTPAEQARDIWIARAGHIRHVRSTRSLNRGVKEVARK